jgi:hypothetical protein
MHFDCLYNVRSINLHTKWLFAPRTNYESHINLVVCTTYEIRITHQFGCLHGVRTTNHTSVWLFARRTKYESHINLVVCTAYELRITPHDGWLDDVRNTNHTSYYLIVKSHPLPPRYLIFRKIFVIFAI